MSMFGKISVGVWRITTGLNIKMSKPRTMNVYGRLRAILTIHMNLHTPRRTTVVAFNQKKIGRAGRSRPADVRKAQKRLSTLCGAQSNSTRLHLRERHHDYSRLFKRPSYVYGPSTKSTGASRVRQMRVREHLKSWNCSLWFSSGANTTYEIQPDSLYRCGCIRPNYRL